MKSDTINKFIERTYPLGYLAEINHCKTLEIEI